MKLSLDQIESRLQSLIEVRLLSALPGFRIEDLVVQKFAEAMKSHLIEEEEGTSIAPNVYTLVVHPDNAAKWKEPALQEALIQSIRIVGEEAGFVFQSQPSIYVSPDQELESTDVNVLAAHQSEEIEDTKGIESTNEQELPSDNGQLPDNAFLIVDGIKVFGTGIYQFQDGSSL